MIYIRKNGVFQQVIQFWQSIQTALKSSVFPVFFCPDRNGSPELPEAGDRRAHQADEKLIDIMEDDDDVQNVWHNWEE